MNIDKLYQKNRQLIWGAIAGVISFLLFRFTPVLDYLPIEAEAETAYIFSWNIAIMVYLGMMVSMMMATDHEKIVKRSEDEYEKKRVMLILVFLATISSVVAIITELGRATTANGLQAVLHVAITLLTIVNSWLFIHTMFALYYAHFYYHDAHDDDYPLDFPHDSEPDYFDFIYFAFGIGATGQTSDISFTNKILRRIGTVHSVLAFFYNTAILALMIEMAASLINP